MEKIAAPHKEAFGAAHFGRGVFPIIQNGGQFDSRMTGARFGSIVG